MNINNSKSALLNNSFTSNTQDTICNCLGCNRYADTKISLKIGEKSITILVCKDCTHKFKES
jgi:transcription elongation factor Elf1